jgi:hypothetical protein
MFVESPMGSSPLTGTGRVSTDGNLSIAYHGGHILAQPINLYYIFYGDWSQEANTFALLQSLGQNIGSSPYFAINSVYTNSCGQHVSTSVNLAGMLFDQGSQTNNIGGNTTQIVSASIGPGAFPADPNGIYLVLTAPNVTEQYFCTAACGYHGSMDVNGTRIQYAFIGNARTQCPTECISSFFGNVTTFPNESGADGMANVIAHELSETATDPWGEAWFDSDGQETGDKCNLFFGSTYTSANGGTANTHIGSHDFLLQTIWLAGVHGMCANALTPANATCVDGIFNGGETDVDCGGPCPACLKGGRCAVSTDCDGTWCNSTICSSPNCTNGVKDGIESDIDCGELCPGCAVGQACAFDSDCRGHLCIAGTCADHCHNGVKDVDESDIDCGSSCGGCPDGKQCGNNGDCATDACNLTTHVCVEHCTDGRRDYAEGDVDCGGKCPNACATGMRCFVDTDCQNGPCLGGRCFAYCADFRKDQNETDIDCGGGTCAPCTAGSACLVASDCASGQCTSGRCACVTDADCPAGVSCSSGACSNHCSDGRKDFDETDVDCGGSCGQCGPGLACRSAADCTTTFCRHTCQCTTSANCPSGEVCLAGMCFPHCQDNQKDADETDVDCGGSTCPACGPGLQCAHPSDCSTGFCHHICQCVTDATCPAKNVCLAGMCFPHCQDNRQDLDETGIDCGGADCPQCPLCSNP